MASPLRHRKCIRVIAAVILCAAVAAGGLTLYGKYRMRQIPDLCFEDALAYTVKNNPDAVITVGILKDGDASYKVYGENGKLLPPVAHTYEIGSLTKTFTASLISRAAADGKIDLSCPVDAYLPLPEGRSYPTVAELLTHTSGYRGYYFEAPMISNFLKGRNDFYGITKEMVLERAGRPPEKKEPFAFHYSNFGYAVLGMILEEVYDRDYRSLLNEFTQVDLGLTDTKISDQSGDLGHYWDWNTQDAYLPAGAVTSSITDLLSYARMQMNGVPLFDRCHQSLRTINAAGESYESMGIRMDQIGMAWILDTENGIVWHNGGTGNYNCYLGFDPDHQTAVVILSNLAPNERIPATVLGIKLLRELSRDSQSEREQ